MTPLYSIHQIIIRKIRVNLHQILDVRVFVCFSNYRYFSESYIYVIRCFFLSVLTKLFCFSRYPLYDLKESYRGLIGVSFVWSHKQILLMIFVHHEQQQIQMIREYFARVNIYLNVIFVSSKDTQTLLIKNLIHMFIVISNFFNYTMTIDS